MKEKLIKFLIRLVPFTLVTFFIQYFIVNYGLEENNLYYSTYAIYLFHLLSTFFVFALLVVINNYFKDKTGFAFMGAGMLKMLAAVIFLLPMLLNHSGNAFANLLSFFIPYFLYLAFETFYAVKLINAQ